MQNDAAVQAMLDHFFDPDAVKNYAEGPRRFVPGFADLHRMTSSCWRNRRARRARAGARRRRRPGVEVVGGDRARLDLCRRRSGRGDAETGGTDAGAAQRARAAPARLYRCCPRGPFDAATCLLTLHFLDADERRRTAGEIHRRLKPGAPFVAAHSSFPQGMASARPGCRDTPLMDRFRRRSRQSQRRPRRDRQT